jgi:hypothetical protein
LAVMNSAAVNMAVQVSPQYADLNLSDTCRKAV